MHIVAEKNKLFTTALGCVTLTQFFSGVMWGCRFLRWGVNDSSLEWFFEEKVYPYFSISASVWPVADIDPFRLCFSNEPAVHQVIIVSFSLVYGEPCLHSPRGPV